MVVPFGVGVGDFLDTIAIAYKILKALGDAHGAAAHYRAIVAVLSSLEDALLHLRRIEYEDQMLAASVEAATIRLRATLDRFIGKLRRYSSTLQLNSSAEKWKKVASKIRWTFSAEKDVQNFQDEILGQASGILVLLQTANIYVDFSGIDRFSLTIPEMQHAI